MPQKDFLELYRISPELQQYMSELQGLYLLENRGRVSVFQGKFSGMKFFSLLILKAYWESSNKRSMLEELE